jgi:hypothetical protein
LGIDGAVTRGAPTRSSPHARTDFSGSGGTWMPEDDDEVADDEAECLREALWWLVALYRP